jgi:tetratricopeptide (TPR) repeat protein
LKDDVLLESTLKRAVVDFPNDASLLTELVNLYIKLKRDDECIEFLQKGLAANPNNSAVLVNLGTLLSNKGQNDQALEYYNKALALSPDSYDINYNVGANFYNRAVPIYNRVNQMKIDEYNKSGKKLEEEANELLKKAVPYFEKANSLQPKDEDIKKVLRDTYYRLKLKDKAEAVK